MVYLEINIFITKERRETSELMIKFKFDIYCDNIVL